MNTSGPPADDDPTVPDDVLLHRWVSRYEIVPDENIGRWRPSTNAFKKGTRRGKGDRMSVFLEDTLQDQFRSAFEYVDDRTTVGCFTAGFLRHDCEQCVRRAPTITDDAHADVIGPERGSILKKMARTAICLEGEWEAAHRSAA